METEQFWKSTKNRLFPADMQRLTCLLKINNYLKIVNVVLNIKKIFKVVRITKILLNVKIFKNTIPQPFIIPQSGAFVNMNE